MYSPPTPTPQDQANKSTRMNQGSGANAKKGNFPILKSVPIRGEEGYCQWDRRWITFSVTAYQESSLFSNAMFRCQNIISLAPTRSSFFIAGRGGGGGGGFFWKGWGDHLIFRRTKEGISRNWEPKTGDHWKRWKDQGRGETARKSSNVIREITVSEVTLKRGMSLVTHQF